MTGDVLSRNKFTRFLVCPQLILVVWVQIEAALLGALPVLGNALVDVGLVDNLGDQLRFVVDGVRVWGWEFAAQDCIFAASGDQQAQQRPHAVHCEAQDQDGNEDKNGDASPHGDGVAVQRSPFWSRGYFSLRTGPGV